MDIIINKTPHSIKVRAGALFTKYEPEGEPIRLTTKVENCGCLYQIEPSQLVELADGYVSLTKTIFVKEGVVLPPIVEGTYYIVSALVAQAFPERLDFLIVNETIRNDKGVIVGCNSLSRNPFSQTR